MYLSPRLTRYAALAVSAMVFTGCASLKVNSFLERGADFGRYHTYTWDESGPGATGNPRLDNNPFFQERVRADVEKQLATRGFERMTSGTPDLVIDFHASIDQLIDVKDADRKYGACEDCRVSVYDAGTLLLDFVDARTDTLVWRGWAEDSMDGVVDNQAWMEAEVDAAVTAILARLPRTL